ncbi:MAG: zinc-ribbon domain-containing protein [Verrucomicrobiae bacterium]|nr:zinc-ribbon domain-containing protein [Verrucomicrobiae bacterium]
MKITCQSCQSKYTVSDEKVQGRTVKIKCRKCGATILVNSAGATNGGVADPVSSAPSAADGATEAALDAKLGEADSADLPVPVADLMARYVGKSFSIEGLGKLAPTALEMKRAIVKYGRAVAHTERMARHIARVLGARPYDLEMSVDETDNPTTLVEHLFVGLELKRRGIAAQSLALRFLGEFQKGVDYIGDLAAFEKSFREQFAVARYCGPYKMSIHSGSDKFSIFPIIGRIAGDLVHEKTAGTSYLEALRVVARADARLFREIWAFALDRFPTDRATYHVVEKLTTLPDLGTLSDAKLETLFENNDGRQLLHVTFGSVLNEKDAAGALRFKPRFFQVLREQEEMYAQVLERHFIRHMESLGMAKR